MNNTQKNKFNSAVVYTLAILMVVMFTIVSRCVYDQLTDTASITRLNNGYFNNAAFPRKMWILSVFLTFGPVGVTLFLLVTGYLAIPLGKSMDIADIAKRILLQIGVASALLVCISAVYYHFSNGVYVRLLDTGYFNLLSWFAGCLFLILLIGKLWLHEFLLRLDQKQYIEFLLCCLAVVSFGWSGELADHLAEGLRILGSGIFIYAFGGFIHRYDPLSKLRTRTLFFLLISIYGIIFLSEYNYDSVYIHNYILSNDSSVFIQNVQTFPYYSIIVILPGILIFELLRRMRIPSNIKLLNFLGDGALMVYLVHDNSFFYNIAKSNDWITLLHHSASAFTGTLLLWTCLTYIAGILIYLCYVSLKYAWQHWHKIFFRI